LHYNILADSNKIKELDIAIGDQIMVICNPMGLKHRRNNLPLVRGGILATQIGESLEDEQKDLDGTHRKRVLRGFLIDGAVIPGSSGSPVVLKPASFRYVKNQLQMGTNTRLLLGIIAETRYAPIVTPSFDFQSFAGLGLAFDADIIKETIELFFR
jgi:hypothetical protein